MGVPQPYTACQAWSGERPKLAELGGATMLRRCSGGMAERLKAHAWKACVRESVPWVRIPLPPPTTVYGVLPASTKPLKSLDFRLFHLYGPPLIYTLMHSELVDNVVDRGPLGMAKTMTATAARNQKTSGKYAAGDGESRG